MKLAVIGSGNVGSAIARAAKSTGHEVVVADVAAASLKALLALRVMLRNAIASRYRAIASGPTSIGRYELGQVEQALADSASGRWLSRSCACPTSRPPLRRPVFPAPPLGTPECVSSARRPRRCGSISKHAGPKGRTRRPRRMSRRRGRRGRRTPTRLPSAVPCRPSARRSRCPRGRRGSPGGAPGRRRCCPDPRGRRQHAPGTQAHHRPGWSSGTGPGRRKTSDPDTSASDAAPGDRAGSGGRSASGRYSVVATNAGTRPSSPDARRSRTRRPTPPAPAAPRDRTRPSRSRTCRHRSTPCRSGGGSSVR
jgi:hypothetical protein